jgi:hypothetical protein
MLDMRFSPEWILSLPDRAKRDAGCNPRLYLNLAELSNHPSVTLTVTPLGASKVLDAELDGLFAYQHSIPPRSVRQLSVISAVKESTAGER